MSALIDHQNYLARADAARVEADAATLDNVRDRCLRAEVAWREMAGRTARTLKLRAAKTAEAAELEALAGEAG